MMTTALPALDLYAPGQLAVEAKRPKSPGPLLEGCNSQRTGHTQRRGIPVTYPVQHGWADDGRRIMRPHTNVPVAIACGHIGRATALGCAGCANQHRA